MQLGRRFVYDSNFLFGGCRGLAEHKVIDIFIKIRLKNGQSHLGDAFGVFSLLSKVSALESVYIYIQVNHRYVFPPGLDPVFSEILEFLVVLGIDFEPLGRQHLHAAKVVPIV
jgi:hypothetical protein